MARSSAIAEHLRADGDPPPRHPMDPAPELTASEEAEIRAIERLYLQEHGRLSRYFERRVPPGEAQDLVQESFRRILGHRPERPGAFLGRTAANLLIEVRRAAARRWAAFHDSFDEQAVPGTDPVPHLEARDNVARVAAALEQLPAKTRNIFLLSRIEGKTYGEIAGAYGMSEEGVRKQVARAMHHLRRRVGDL